jgi:hypothetical protein
MVNTLFFAPVYDCDVVYRGSHNTKDDFNPHTLWKGYTFPYRLNTFFFLEKYRNMSIFFQYIIIWMYTVHLHGMMRTRNKVVTRMHDFTPFYTKH